MQIKVRRKFEAMSPVFNGDGSPMSVTLARQLEQLKGAEAAIR